MKGVSSAARPQAESNARDRIALRQTQHEERLLAHFTRLDSSERLRGAVTSDRALHLLRDRDFSQGVARGAALELLRGMNAAVPENLPRLEREAVLMVNTKVAIALAATGGGPGLALCYAVWTLEAIAGLDSAGPVKLAHSPEHETPRPIGDRTEPQLPEPEAAAGCLSDAVCG